MFVLCMLLAFSRVQGASSALATVNVHQNHMHVQYTPLLPAVATGTIEDRSIVEPVRRIVGSKV